MNTIKQGKFDSKKNIKSANLSTAKDCIVDLVGDKGEYAKDPWVQPSSTRVAKMITAQNLLKRILRKDDLKRNNENTAEVKTNRARRGSVLQLKRQRRKVLDCHHCQRRLMERSGFCTTCQTRGSHLLSDMGGYQFSAKILSWAGCGETSAFFLPRTNVKDKSWIREKDPGNHMRPFYFNCATGESTWTRPKTFCAESDIDDDSWMDRSSITSESLTQVDQEGETEEDARVDDISLPDAGPPALKTGDEKS